MYLLRVLLTLFPPSVFNSMDDWIRIRNGNRIFVWIFDSFIQQNILQLNTNVYFFYLFMVAMLRLYLFCLIRWLTTLFCLLVIEIVCRFELVAGILFWFVDDRSWFGLSIRTNKTLIFLFQSTLCTSIKPSAGEIERIWMSILSVYFSSCCYYSAWTIEFFRSLSCLLNLNLLIFRAKKLIHWQ